ncbi:MAG: redoxin domain-containing protein [Bacteroidota bacterium]
MKKITTLFILIAISFSALANAGKPAYQIKGNIKGLTNVDIYLANYYGDKQYLKDTAHADATGNFVFEGKPLLPGGIYLVVTPRKTYFEIIIDKEQNFSFTTDTMDFIKNMVIKGSVDNQLFYDYLKEGVLVQKKIDSLTKTLSLAKTKADTTAAYDAMKNWNKHINDYREQFAKDHPGTLLAKLFKSIPEPDVPTPPTLPNGRPDSVWSYYYFRNHFLDNVDFGDGRMLRTPVFHQKLEKFITVTVPQIPDTIIYEADKLVERARLDSEMFKYVVWWITYHYETSKIMGLDAVFVHMVEKYVQTNQCWWYDSTQTAKLIDRARKISPNLIGNKAPNLKMLDMYMNPIDMSEIKSDWLIIVFWDPTCGHCKKEIPKLDSLYKELLRTNGVEVWGVNLDGTQKEWMDYVEEHHLEWINVWDPYNASNFRKLYDISSTPVIYVLDKDRNIRYKRIDVDQVREIFQKIVDDKKKK